MKNIKTIITIIIVLIFIIGAIVLIKKGAAKEEATNETPLPVATSTPTATYTLADVQTHKTAADCWTTINGKVYNVTSWIDKHPGGPQAIISLCGNDGSAAFNGQHGGQARPAAELASFMIGTLK